MVSEQSNSPIITLDYLMRNHPGVMQEIRSDIIQRKTLEERERILAILKTPMASLYGGIINAAIANGDTPEQAAAAILAKEGRLQ